MPKRRQNNQGGRPSGKRRRLNRGLVKPRMNAVCPPQFESNVLFGHTYRFVSTSGTATAITPLSLMGAAGAICTTSLINVTCFSAAVKLNHIKMWSPPASQGSAVTCSVLWAGSVTPFTPDKEESDTSVSVAVPAHLHARPPKNSLASFWQTVSSNNLFTLSAPVGTVIDVNLSLILYDDDGPSAANITTTAATFGATYYLSLDPVATHRYVPVSLTTTV